MTKKPKEQEPTFEEALLELEQVTRQLEAGDLTLEDSIRAYERGVELKRFCEESLKKAEKRLEYLHKGKATKASADASEEEESQVERRPFAGHDENELQEALF